MQELLQSEEDLTRRGVLKQSMLAAMVTGTGAVGTVAGETGANRHYPATEQTESIATQTGWAQQAKLTAADGESGDGFGFDTVLSDDGTTALIGAHRDSNSNGELAGSVYVFSQDAGAWAQQAKLTPDDGTGSDQFGSSIGLSNDGTTAVIGAPYDDNPNGESAGSAYVFTEDPVTEDAGTWTQQTKLTPNDGDGDDWFGFSIELSSDGATAVIGARNDDDPNGESAGSAYVFSKDGGVWTQQAKLSPEDGGSNERFGLDIGLSEDGTTAVIGARWDDDPNGEWAGSAYVFSGDGGTWSQQAKLIPDDGSSDDRFGVALELSEDGTTALIGAHRDDNPNGDSAGSAYVFTQDAGTWTQQTKLTPDDGDSSDLFGADIGLSDNGTTGVIGAFHDEDPNGSRAGSAYVFSEDNGTWTEQTKFAPNDGGATDQFGIRIGLSEHRSTAVISAPSDDNQNGLNAGSAYVFTGNSADTREAVTTESSVDPVAPGGDFEITYHLTNVRDTTVDGGRLELSLPSGIELIDVSGDGRSELTNSPPSVSYGDSGSISAGETLTTTLQFSVSDSIEPGTVDITATGFLDGAGQVGTRTLSVEIAEDVVARFDTDGDQAIGFRDLLNAIAAYNNNREVGSEPVGLLDLLEVISAYNQ